MLKGGKANIKILIISPIIIAFIIALALAPYFLGDYYLSLLRNIYLWAALSISWHFFSGLTKYVSLGSAAFFGLGLYFTAKFHPIMPLPAIVILAGLINFSLALVIGLVTLRLKGIYFAILTFGVSEVLKNAVYWWEIKVTGTLGTYLPRFDTQTQYYYVLITMLAIFVLTFFFRRSRFGLALKMVGECEEAAVHVGVNSSLFKTIGFAVSAMCFGFMGSCFITRYTYIKPDTAFDPQNSFLPAIMTLLGGAGTVYGPLIGSTTISLLREYLQVTSPQFFLIILGVILIAIVLFMPNGIMGVIERLKERKLRKIVKVPKMPP